MADLPSQHVLGRSDVSRDTLYNDATRILAFSKAALLKNALTPCQITTGRNIIIPSGRLNVIIGHEGEK